MDVMNFFAFLGWITVYDCMGPHLGGWMGRNEMHINWVFAVYFNMKSSNQFSEK